MRSRATDSLKVQQHVRPGLARSHVANQGGAGHHDELQHITSKYVGR
jgi:hypothetical protein